MLQAPIKKDAYGSRELKKESEKTFKLVFHTFSTIQTELGSIQMLHTERECELEIS